MREVVGVLEVDARELGRSRFGEVVAGVPSVLQSEIQLPTPGASH